MAASLGGPGLFLSARRDGVVESGRACHGAVYFGATYCGGIFDEQRRDNSSKRRDIEAIAGDGLGMLLTFRDERTPEGQALVEESAAEAEVVPSDRPVYIHFNAQ